MPRKGVWLALAVLLVLPIYLLVQEIGFSEGGGPDAAPLGAPIASPTAFPPNTCGKTSTGELLPCELTGSDFDRALSIALADVRIARSLGGEARGPDKTVFPEGYSVLRISPMYSDPKTSKACPMTVPATCAEVLLRDYVAARDYTVDVNLAESGVVDISEQSSDAGALPEETEIARSIAEADPRVQDFLAQGGRFDTLAGVPQSDRNPPNHLYGALVYMAGDGKTALVITVDLTDRAIAKIDTYP